MLLPALMMCSVLLCPASSSIPSAAPAVESIPPLSANSAGTESDGTTSATTASAGASDASPPTAEPQASHVTLDQVIAALSEFQRDTARAATAKPLAELANTLTSVLDLLHEIQLQQQKTQTAVQRQLDAIEAFQSALSGRVDTVLQQQQQQLDAIEASQDALSGRADTVLQQQQQQQLDAIQAAINHIPKIVLGKACSSDTECSGMLPEAVCGSDGRCSCRGGFIQVSDKVSSGLSACRKASRLTESCLKDADCQTLVSNTTCTHGQCGCVTGFWNHNNAECRQVSAVNKDGSCVGDQDCDSRLHLRCVSGTCSCLVRAVGEYEYRLVGGRACNEGNLELRRDGGSWGVACDDGWSTTNTWGPNNANVICRSLGFSSGSPTRESRYGRSSNFYMDDVKCDGTETHLMNCPYGGWGVHDCKANEVAGA